MTRLRPTGRSPRRRGHRSEHAVAGAHGAVGLRFSLARTRVLLHRPGQVSPLTRRSTVGDPASSGPHSVQGVTIGRDTPPPIGARIARHRRGGRAQGRRGGRPRARRSRRAQREQAHHPKDRERARAPRRAEPRGDHRLGGSSSSLADPCESAPAPSRSSGERGLRAAERPAVRETSRRVSLNASRRVPPSAPSRALPRSPSGSSRPGSRSGSRSGSWPVTMWRDAASGVPPERAVGTSFGSASDPSSTSSGARPAPRAPPVTIDPRLGLVVSVPPATRRGWARPEDRVDGFLRGARRGCCATSTGWHGSETRHGLAAALATAARSSTAASSTAFGSGRMRCRGAGPPWNGAAAIPRTSWWSRSRRASGGRSSESSRPGSASARPRRSTRRSRSTRPRSASSRRRSTSGTRRAGGGAPRVEAGSCSRGG